MRQICIHLGGDGAGRVYNILNQVAKQVATECQHFLKLGWKPSGSGALYKILETKGLVSSHLLI
jgi:hypothetical protein